SVTCSLQGATATTYCAVLLAAFLTADYASLIRPAYFGTGQKNHMGRTPMLDRNRIGLIALCAVFMLSAIGARAFDDTIYPDWKGQWRPIGGPMRFDPGKPWGPGQEAPLTAEYQAIFQANLADQAAGGQGL